MGKDNAKLKSVRMDEDTHRELKAVCALRGKRMSDAVTEATQQWLEEQRPQADKAG